MIFLRNKVALIGDSNVGKTSLVNKIIKKDQFMSDNNTIGCAFTSLNVSVDGKYDVKFHIWDTAGQERFHSLVPMYIRDTTLIIIVFDM